MSPKLPNRMLVLAMAAVMQLMVILLAIVLSGCGEDARAAHASRRTVAAAAPTPSSESVIEPGALAPDVSSVDHTRLHPGSDPHSSCTCDAAKLRNGWCWRCNVGYIAGARIESATLFEALDPHGHELDNECLQLQMCRDVIRADGYCDAVGIGFVGGKAYFTRLTYGVARGQVLDPATLACPICRSHIAQSGWCAGCRRGIVGNVAFSDRDLFDRTSHEYCRLLQAIERAPVCDMCALAMVAHSTCPMCRMSYESETPTPLTTSANR